MNLYIILTSISYWFRKINTFLCRTDIWRNFVNKMSNIKVWLMIINSIYPVRVRASSCSSAAHMIKWPFYDLFIGVSRLNIDTNRESGVFWFRNSMIVFRLFYGLFGLFFIFELVVFVVFIAFGGKIYAFFNLILYFRTNRELFWWYI